MNFLETIAHDLLTCYGYDLSHITVVFPNKRARLFLNEYLCEGSMQPVWAPAYSTLDELFRAASPLQTADPLLLIAELYRSYSEIYSQNKTQTQSETFDEFYFFGEMLLRDFDDIDKNMVDAPAMFSNLADLDSLKDTFEHLNEQQRDAIARFFGDITTRSTPLKSAFYSIWSILGNVYKDFKQKLENKNIAYSGMLFRAVVEHLQTNGIGDLFPQEKYVFAGFNVLTDCEKQFFTILKNNDKALFYWDYPSDAELQKFFPAEVNFFMPDNVRRFGNSFVSTEKLLAKKIRLAASPSDSAQVSCVPQWIESLNLTDGFDKPDSAIVLCNEQHLQSVLHAIPPTAGKVNITMGFPVTQTPVFSLLTSLCDLQLKGSDGKCFRYNYVLPVLRNPYVRLVFPEGRQIAEQMTHENNFFPVPDDLPNALIFSHTENAAEMAAYLLKIVQAAAMAYHKKEQNDDEGRNEENELHDLYGEAFFRVFQTLNRLNDLLLSGDLQLEQATFASLLKRILGSTSVPFHGEPAQGLQVMGVLETRNLDFRNLMIIGLNEGVFPKTDAESSFIPHFIRQYFGMSTTEHQDAIYAYYFYRLLQRADNVVLTYSIANQQTGKAEMSRFVLQLLAESSYKIEHVSLQSEISPCRVQKLEVPKTAEILQRMREKYDLTQNASAITLSPSALNSYIDCSLRFYFRYIEGIKPLQELTDELDNSVFGSVFHKSMELIYREIGRITEEEKDFLPFGVSVEQIEAMLKNKNRLERIIEKAFDSEFFKRPMPRERYNGEQLIYFRIIKQFVVKILRMDKHHAPFEIVGLEHDEEHEFAVADMRLKIGGIIDRLDRKDGVLRVADYKTGGSHVDPVDMFRIFEASKERSEHHFQTFLYASILTKKRTEVIVPALIYIQKSTDEDYSPVCRLYKETIEDFRTWADEYDELLLEKLQELFNPALPFSQTTVERNCDFCDFKRLCGKE